MTNEIVPQGDVIATAHLIARRAAVALRQAVPEAKQAQGGLFVAIPLPSRLVLLVNPRYVGLGLGANFERELSDALNGRRVRVTEVSRRVYIQVAYQPRRGEVKGELPDFTGRQVVIYGPTGSGKSSVIQHIFGLRDGIKIIIDPHYKAGNWHPDTIVIGAGRAWERVEPALDEVMAEMSRRYARRQSGDEDYPDLTIAVDELSALAHYSKDATKKLIDITQEGRKVRVYVILTPHSTEVTQLGMPGAGDARENYVFIGLAPVKRGDETKPRIAEVCLGNPRRREAAREGYYVVPPPTLFQGQARLMDTLAGVFDGVPGESPARVEGTGHGQTRVNARFEDIYRPDTPETTRLVEYLAANGYSQRKIAEFLPIAAATARSIASRVLSETEPIARPGPGTQDESVLVAELASEYHAPANRIARLLDGNDHDNLKRVERILAL